MRALIIFASSEGQTEKVANYLAERLRQNAVPTDTFKLTKYSGDQVGIESYDAVLFGSPIHYGEYDAQIQYSIRDNLPFLRTVPTAFFSVSLGIHSKHPTDQSEVVELTEEFFNDFGFAPNMTGYFAGALRYSRYGYLKKRMMRWIANQHGIKETDFASDSEFTDWDAVDQFAFKFADALSSITNTNDAASAKTRVLCRETSPLTQLS